MLGQHLRRIEQAIGAHLAFRDHAFTFLEQIGKDALVDDRHRLGGIGHDKPHRQTVRIALHAAIFHQSADTESAIDGALPSRTSVGE
jgi:hypothetical protein